MADIRIKDLTTTASSTASDDFIAVDGTTNGTRKLNAFSPTFGGNATVTGTLTVNGATAFVGANTGSPYVLIKGGSSGTNGGGSLVVENGSGGSVIGIGNVSAIAGGAYNNDPVVWYAGSESLRFYNASTEVANFSSTGVLSLLSTTASTTTSSGALVVSGGVGVAGALYLGGLIETSSGSGIRIRTASGTAAKFSTIQTGWVTGEMQNKASTTNLAITADGSVDALTLTNTGNAVVGGSITTSAPTGGAGAWELGTYSSTAPSATGYVTIEIGGTVYKLLASNV